MKKTLIIIFSIIAVIAIALIFIFTRHKHVFSEATCTTAPTCECGEIQGEPLGHTWIDATYESPKTCELCGLTDGEPLTNADRGTASGEAITNTEVETPTENETPTEDINETLGIYDSLDTNKHFTQNADGTYSYSDEFIGAITGYSYLDGATEKEVMDFLDINDTLIYGLDGKAIHEMMLTLEGSNLHQTNVELGLVTDDTQKTSNQGSNQNSQSTNQNSQSSSGNSSSSGGNNNAGNTDNRPPENSGGGYIDNGDGTITSSDGTFTMGDGSSFGGGERDNTGATLH